MEMTIKENLSSKTNHSNKNLHIVITYLWNSRLITQHVGLPVPFLRNSLLSLLCDKYNSVKKNKNMDCSSLPKNQKSSFSILRPVSGMIFEGILGKKLKNSENVIFMAKTVKPYNISKKWCLDFLILNLKNLF
jgi:hypothetical protein